MGPEGLALSRFNTRARQCRRATLTHPPSDAPRGRRVPRELSPASPRWRGFSQRGCGTWIAPAAGARGVSVQYALMRSAPSTSSAYCRVDMKCTRHATVGPTTCAASVGSEARGASLFFWGGVMSVGPFRPLVGSFLAAAVWIMSGIARAPPTLLSEFFRLLFLEGYFCVSFNFQEGVGALRRSSRDPPLVRPRPLEPCLRTACSERAQSRHVGGNGERLWSTSAPGRLRPTLAIFLIEPRRPCFVMFCYVFILYWTSFFF